MPSHDHCYELWQMALLLLSWREAHTALPKTFYCLDAPGLGWLLQPKQLVRDFTRRAETPPVPLQWQNQPPVTLGQA